MTKPTIWHNPSCSKSRETLFMLRDKGYDPNVREYLDDAPTIYQIEQVLKKLGLGAVDIIRTGEARFAQLGLSPNTDSQTLIAAMAAHPILIERPIVISGDRAALGRPTAAVLDIL